jgi:hypothetical protein
MMDHMEKEFLQYFASDDDVPCPHYDYMMKGFTLLSVMAFKRHCVDYYKIFLHP